MAMSLNNMRGRNAASFFGWVLTALLLCLLTVNCSKNSGEHDAVRRLTKPMMGTLVEVLWRESGEVDSSAEVREAMDRMEALSESMNLKNPLSEIARINAGAGRNPIRVSRQIIDLIEISLEASRLTGGDFDITVGSVEAVWGDIQWGGVGSLPKEKELQEALSKVGYLGIQVDLEKGTVFLKEEGTRLDFGGVAKGYVIDRGIEWLQEKGLGSLMINAGGDIRASCNPEGPWWRVGLQDPFEKDNLLGVFRIRQGAVVTSGSYERYAETERGRISHIFDPHSGRPAEGLVSVTVLAQETAIADALATALMVKGRPHGVALLKKIGKVSAVFVEADGTIWMDQELKEVLMMNQPTEKNRVRYFGPIPSSS